MLILIMPSILSVSRSGSKVFMGRGGGGRKGSCRTSRARSPKPLTAGVQDPLKCPGSSRGWWCLLVLSEPYFKVFWYNMGFKKNIVDHILGGRTPVAPPPPPPSKSATEWFLLWAKRITVFLDNGNLLYPSRFNSAVGWSRLPYHVFTLRPHESHRLTSPSHRKKICWPHQGIYFLHNSTFKITLQRNEKDDTFLTFTDKC